MAYFPQNSTSISEIYIASTNITNLSNSGLQRLTFSDKVTDDIIFVTECFLYPIISVFGLIGNVLSIAILLNTKMRTSTCVSLATLAVSDSLFLITNTLWKSTCIIKSFDKVLYYKYYAYGFSVLFYLKTSFSRISSWLVVLIASEKMVAVTFPLQVKNYFTKRNIWLLIVIISAATFIFMSPFCLKFTVGYIYDWRLQTLRAYLKETGYYRENKTVIDNYTNYFLVIAFRYVPMALVLVVNIKNGIALWKNKRSRQVTFPNNRSFAESREEHRITIVLVTVVTVFIICLLPGNIHVAVTMVVEEYRLYGKYHNLFIAMGNISLLFEVVNSSVIFFIYIMRSKTFMQVFKGILYRCTTKSRASVAPADSSTVQLLETQPKPKVMSTLEVSNMAMTVSTLEVPGTTMTMLALEVKSTTHLDQSSQADSSMA